MKVHRLALILAGAAATAVISFGGTIAHGPGFIAGIERRAEAARNRAGGQGITMSFTTPEGWLTRHPLLTGGDGLDEAVRVRAAAAIAGVPGIGGASWRAAPGRQHGLADPAGAPESQHCQQDVEAILKARSIRFDEASAAIDPGSREVLDEVAGALRPCVGSIIAITGHTNASGDEAANYRLSRQRADAVRRALSARGIPADGLRAAGVGSQQPVKGLEPADPANRRIEFSVISTMPLQPTPVDTPGPG